MSAQSRKLNDLLPLAKFQVLPGTFPAISAYAEMAKGPLQGAFGTLAGALSSGFTGAFIAPVLPRDLRLNTSKEVFDANLDYQIVEIEKIEDQIVPDIIVSRHAGTVDMLQCRYGQDLPVLSGNLEAEEVKNKTVVGTLPPHLAAEAEGYIPVRIKDFDYSKDGDLSGDELLSRLIVDDPVRVIVK